MIESTAETELDREDEKMNDAQVDNDLTAASVDGRVKNKGAKYRKSYDFEFKRRVLDVYLQHRLTLSQTVFVCFWKKIIFWCLVLVITLVRLRLLRCVTNSSCQRRMCIG